MRIKDGVLYKVDNEDLNPDGTFTFPEGITEIGGGAFSWNCPKLTKITIPDTITKIGAYAFNFCVNLSEIVISNSVTTIEMSAFWHTAYWNNESNWENGVLYIGSHLINTNDTLKGSYVIKEGTKVIAEKAFNSRNITRITIPDSVTEINWGAFGDCRKLTEVIIPDSITTLSPHVFDECTKLTKVKIPDAVTAIKPFAFADCKKLQSLPGIYKVFNADMTDNGYQFEMNEWADTIDTSDMQKHKRGYLYFTNLFNMFDFDCEINDDTVICICEIGSETKQINRIRSIANTIKPIKRLTGEEIIKILNGEEI